MDVDIDLEDLMGYLGEFGKYQRTQFLLHILAALTAGVHMLSLVNVAAVPEHRCLIPGENQSNPYPWNSEEVKEAIPFVQDKPDSCSLFGPDNSTYRCNEWVYDDTYFKSSRAIDWNFVCDQRWMGIVAQTAYMFGVFTGAVFLGSLADKIGRKKIFYISAVLQLIFGVSVAFVNEYNTFVVLTYLYGIFGSAGSYITGFVLSMELVGPTKRTVCGITFQASFAGGLLLVAFWGWLIPDRILLQVVYGLHSALLIGHWWLIDESPRWLWAHGRCEEAVAIVQKALKINRNENVLDSDRFLDRTKINTKFSNRVESAGILSLLKTPNLSKRTMNVCLNWFANSLAYYGLSLNTGTLPGNPYLMIFVTGLVEYPSYVTVCLYMDKVGRRSMISSFMIAGGFLCILAGFLSQDTSAGSNAVIAIVMIGKFFIAGSFAIIYNYTAELFPTVVRNTALGVGSMCARLSGALTPPLALLDSLNKRLPVVIFASVAITSGLLALLLPETLNQPMPQSLEDGERFGENDTACASCLGKKKKYEVPLTVVN